MKCPKCQTENPDKRKFCRECGAKLLNICPQCGAENSPDDKFCGECGYNLLELTTQIRAAEIPPSPPSAVPTSFANGRFQVKKFLGEGGKKKVYLAYDTVLDRDIAFYLIKTEKLDESARTRIKREAQAMGRLGDHPNIVTIFDFGDHEGQPYMVAPLMPGDVEKLIEKAPDRKLPLDKAIEIARSVCKGLEFAHAKGIIHRDIKPGNVLLTADSTAKVGDFGLAVAVDLSRLTQEGMMVGTYYYMPPEQAIGGKVTAKADLYSLGAMLYEMVTGRPPFVGDDSVAIIGQHINTSPVSPSWHRADLPPSLEILIMQLLEKDPEKRPESATIVLQTLEAIKAGKISEPSKEIALSESSLYRTVFVGREAELLQLQSAFNGAMSGQGALMMVVGEPGIGKTAICEQLATYVTLRGGKILLGHCYEEGSLSLPYLAFVEAMRSYVISREVKDLRKQLGTGAADVARIVSEIRERLKVKLRPAGNPEEERYRLLQAVTSFLSNAASVQPLLVVLEDLHDADKGTLEMLTHVSRNLTGTRLLLIGTYRDVEVDRTHPLSAALAELRRVSTYGRVLLRGLNADEVRRMLEGITRESVPWGLAEAVHRQTEGNPLFVQEVVRYLAEEGLITQKEGRWRPARDTPLEMTIPEGLRDVIGKRLSLISKECNQLLSVASVIGRDFRLDVLQKVSGLSEETLFNALEESKKAAVVEERAGVGAAVTYRFAHAFFRQTLYEETIAPRRIRLHQQVARALEEIYASRLEEHAAELAEHFSYSSDAADLKKAVSYGQMAAKRASDVYAYGEAVRLLEQALKVQEILDPEDKGRRCDLLLDLCDALFLVPDTRRIIDTEAPVAFALAESIGDGSRATRVCIAALSAITYRQGAPGFVSPQMSEWAERADQYAGPDTVERVYTDSYLGLIKFIAGDIQSAEKLVTHAIDLARSIDDRDAFWWAATYFITAFRAPQYTEQRMRLVEELWESPRPGSNFKTAQGLLYLGFDLLTMGQRIRFEKTCDELRGIAERTGNITFGLMSAAMDSILAVMDGHLDNAMDMAKNILARGEEAGIFGVAELYELYAGPRAGIYLGESLEDREHLLRGLPVPVDGILNIIVNAQLCLMLAHMGSNEEAWEILEIHVVKSPGIRTDIYEIYNLIDYGFLEASVIIGHNKAAEILLHRLSGTSLCIPGLMYPTCIPRHLGGAAALLGRYDEARDHYNEAIRVCTDMRFRPELALSRLGLAELLLDQYPDEKTEALEHLDFAIKEFREMKMQPSLERALRRKDILKA